ncbi:MAG: Uncharacterized protein G01um101418_514 [Parcubacteria group bacterium Gr01-1014_18]|nr:MAG: Uncharacterized protein Greene041636_560 [Parcubacteria group bacterium Greene0416_36]TSC80977.1 MAG: Uncharacterized protein G01um101418_514 [Parcubacteria group bacterium Gr01-1014_18]TSC98864.1 MAG: Uncharacterized protein Greene101420_497 [Parcubacteria group bacterium Greene1014_20]TSD06550.1 MAG: Uncharacterized protein Greene07142_825 [Parcubacteria group bacterium Greene0714_2]
MFEKNFETKIRREGKKEEKAILLEDKAEAKRQKSRKFQENQERELEEEEESTAKMQSSPEFKEDKQDDEILRSQMLEEYLKSDEYFEDQKRSDLIRYQKNLESQEYVEYLTMLEAEQVKAGLDHKRSNITELIDYERLSDRQRNILERAKEFCHRLSRKFENEFGEILINYSKERKEISIQMKKFLLNKKFDLPQFTISNPYANDNSLLLNFQLPRPLSFFWWKGGANSWGDHAVDMQDQVVEWGHFYRELMPIVWETQGYYEQEKGLSFDRVNAVGEHDPAKYYYLWKIS